MSSVARRAQERGVDRFGLVALVGSGTFAAHEIGYLADGADSVSHAYLGVVGPLLLLGSCLAAWFAAVRVLRHDPGRLPTLGSLVVAQVGVYTMVEIAERLADGSIASLASAPVVLGLLAQPVVAWAALHLLRLGRDVVVRFRRVDVAVARARLTNTPAPVPVHVSSASFTRLRLRGPPI